MSVLQPRCKLIPIIDANKTIALKSTHCYRYILPTPDTGGLLSFYGEDRSFSVGHLFDTADLIIEFQFTVQTPIITIPHHPNSYRGRIQPDNTVITALYLRQPGYDFEDDYLETQAQAIIKCLPHQSVVYGVDSYSGSFINITRVSQVKVC